MLFLAMDEEIASAQNAMASFQKLLDSAEGAIRPMLKAIDAIRESEEPGQIPAMTRARVHATLAYTVNALYYMYLRANAVEADTHPIVDDITRVQNTFSRLRAVETALAGKNNDEPKNVRSMRKAVKKLDAFLVPEEEDLFHAVRGATTAIDRSVKKGHKRFADENSDGQKPEKSTQKSSRKKRKTKKSTEIDTNAVDTETSISPKLDKKNPESTKESSEPVADATATPKSSKKDKKSKSSSKKKSKRKKSKD